MANTALRPEDRIGLVAAAALHVALIAILALQFAITPDPPPIQQRMTVSLASEISLASTAPDPVPESRAATAPTLAETPAPPTRSEPVVSRPRPPVTEPPARPAPRPATRPAARPTERTRPARERPRSRPERPEREAKPSRTAASTGGSRIGNDFLEGQGSSSRTQETRAPAATFGASERAALSSAISRQLRPHWSAPSGVDAEKLVSTVSWRLNKDGSLRGRPSCRTAPGSITDSNRPQAGLHCERAVRAVQLAAPFNLPEQFYSQWDDLEWQFDRRL